MKVDVEINSKQIFEDGTTDEEKNKCVGNIQYYNNGVMLEFTEKYEQQELKFKVNILKGKIVILRNGQNMILDPKNKNKTILDTPYGSMNMIVTTKNIEIKKQENLINQIHLEYQIELENSMKYDNIVDIYCKEKTSL